MAMEVRMYLCDSVEISDDGDDETPFESKFLNDEDEIMNARKEFYDMWREKGCPEGFYRIYVNDDTLESDTWICYWETPEMLHHHTDDHEKLNSKIEEYHKKLIMVFIDDKTDEQKIVMDTYIMPGPYDVMPNEIETYSKVARYVRCFQFVMLGVVLLVVGLVLLSMGVDALKIIVKIFDTYGFKATCSFLFFAGIGSYVTAEILMVVLRIYCRNR